MKKNLSLILVLIMLLGAIVGVMPASAASSDTYVPEIEYANVNYLNNISMMFAVPASTSITEGKSVKLLLWESRLDSISFSYTDTFKNVIDAEEKLVSIKGAKYYLFKYEGLDAAQMTNVICARPVVLENDVAISYGSVIEYSVREYVEAAKGNIDGISPVTKEGVIESLDAMLDFGAFAEDFKGVEPEYKANDPLRSIYVNVKFNGNDKGKVHAGFFKYAEEESFTLNAPFYDGKSIVKITDTEGNELSDVDDFTHGFQILSQDSDVTINVYYENAVVRNVDASVYGLGMSVNNYDAMPTGGNGLITKSSSTDIYLQQASLNFSGDACTGTKMNYWNGVKTVADPRDPDNVVFQFTTTNSPAFSFSNITSADFAGYGFGDTVYPMFTFEITLGAVNGKMPTTDWLNMRYRHSLNGVGFVDLQIFKIDKGVIKLKSGASIGKIPETGVKKFAITIDALTGEVFGYAENDEGVMERTATSKLVLSDEHKKRQQQHFANLADSDPSNDASLIVYESIYTYFTKASKLESIWFFGSNYGASEAFESSSIVIDGFDTPIVSSVDSFGDKVFNMEAVQALAERDYSFLLDDFKFIMGSVYN